MGAYGFREDVSVQAPPEEVWRLLVDVERWPSWTPSVRETSLLDPGPLRVGSRVRLAQPRLPVATWTVTELDPGRSFSWTSTSGGVRTTAVHEVAPAPAAGSLLQLGIRHTGLLAWVAAKGFGRLTRRYLRMEAHGLKQRAEAGSRGA